MVTTAETTQTQLFSPALQISIEKATSLAMREGREGQTPFRERLRNIGRDLAGMDEYYRAQILPQVAEQSWSAKTVAGLMYAISQFVVMTNLGKPGLIDKAGTLGLTQHFADLASSEHPNDIAFTLPFQKVEGIQTEEQVATELAGTALAVTTYYKRLHSEDNPIAQEFDEFGVVKEQLGGIIGVKRITDIGGTRAEQVANSRHIILDLAGKPFKIEVIDENGLLSTEVIKASILDAITRSKTQTLELDLRPLSLLPPSEFADISQRLASVFPISEIENAIAVIQLEKDSGATLSEQLRDIGWNFKNPTKFFWDEVQARLSSGFLVNHNGADAITANEVIKFLRYLKDDFEIEEDTLVPATLGCSIPLELKDKRGYVLLASSAERYLRNALLNRAVAEFQLNTATLSQSSKDALEKNPDHEFLVRKRNNVFFVTIATLAELWAENTGSDIRSYLATIPVGYEKLSPDGKPMAQNLDSVHTRTGILMDGVQSFLDNDCIENPNNVLNGLSELSELIDAVVLKKYGGGIATNANLIETVFGSGKRSRWVANFLNNVLTRFGGVKELQHNHSIISFLGELITYGSTVLPASGRGTAVGIAKERGTNQYLFHAYHSAKEGDIFTPQEFVKEFERRFGGNMAKLEGIFQRLAKQGDP